MKAMVLAAGFGTRLKPLTNTLPKALVSYKGEPMIMHQIEKLKKLGVSEIVVNAHHFSEKMRDFFASRKFGVNGSLIIEDEILGTGGGILNAKDLLTGEGPFIVINVDVESDMDLEKMIKFHKENDPLATLAVQKRNSSRYLEFTPEMKLKVRGKAGTADDSLFAFNGMHIVSERFFEENFKEGFSDILDLYFEAIKSGGEVVKGFDAGTSSFKDLGKPENLN